MKRFRRLLFRAPTASALVALGGVAACSPGPAFTEPVTFGTRVVQPHTLEEGRDIYNRFCANCHGLDGTANTAAARQMDPPPRDLTQALFKHKTSPGNQLPTDADLIRVIQHGVPGTGMAAWGHLASTELDAVTQYLKMFSPRWRAGSPASETGSKRP